MQRHRAHLLALAGSGGTALRRYSDGRGAQPVHQHDRQIQFPRAEERKAAEYFPFPEILDFIGGILKNRKANEYINADGNVDCTDAMLLNRYASGWAETDYADAVNLLAALATLG